MNTQERMIDRRTFRIAAIGVAAVAVLVVAAYLFGTRLQAETPGSVVASESAASLVALAQSRADFYADLNNSAAAASSSASLSATEYAAKFGIPAASVVMPESAGAKSSAADPYQNEWMGFTSPESVKPRSSAATTSASPDAVGASLPADFHDSSADFYGKPDTSYAADPYQNERMGFTSPESVLPDLSDSPPLEAELSPSIRSEGINPSAAERPALLDMIQRTGSADYSTRARGLWYDIPAPGTMASPPPAGSASSSVESSVAESAALLDMIQRTGSADYSTRARGLWFDIPAPGTMASPPPAGSQLLVASLGGGMGSTIGPDGALYVTEPIAGRISRIDPKTGDVTTFASGLPTMLPAVGLGGVMDVAFIDQTAYALVTLVGPDVGGSDVVGVYRVDGPHSFTVVADVGQWSIDNPPPGWPVDYDVATGVQYAMQPYRGGFLVTDGHHNRVLKVGLDGSITQSIQFGDDVPTGLESWGNRIYVAQAGPIPHLPGDGKIVSFEERSPTPTQVAAGAPLLVDVEFGLGRSLYGLSQGTHDNPGPAGSPADPNTGSLIKVNSDGTFTVITGELNQPTSLEFIGNTAYVVTLNGEVRKIEGVSDPPFGVVH